MPCLTQNYIFQSSLSAIASFAVFLCEDQLILHYRFVTLKLTLSVLFVNLDHFYCFHNVDG